MDINDLNNNIIKGNNLFTIIYCSPYLKHFVVILNTNNEFYFYDPLNNEMINDVITKLCDGVDFIKDQTRDQDPTT